jgi:hypothetical protein
MCEEVFDIAHGAIPVAVMVNGFSINKLLQAHRAIMVCVKVVKPGFHFIEHVTSVVCKPLAPFLERYTARLVCVELGKPLLNAGGVCVLQLSHVKHTISIGIHASVFSQQGGKAFLDLGFFGGMIECSVTTR